MRTNAIIRLPLVLADGKDTASEGTPDPSIAVDCTIAIPPVPPPFELIVMLSALLAVCELLSVTCTVKLLVPDALGVPEISPLPEFRASPAGRLPVVIDQ